MDSREELESELADARKTKDEKYEVKGILLREMDILDDDISERIKRMEEYSKSESMGWKDKDLYENKKQDALKKYWDFYEARDEFIKRIDKQCEEADYRVYELESKLEEPYEEEKEKN